MRLNSCPLFLSGRLLSSGSLFLFCESCVRECFFFIRNNRARDTDTVDIILTFIVNYGETPLSITIKVKMSIVSASLALLSIYLSIYILIKV